VTDARSLAARVLQRVEREGAYAAAALSSALEREVGLDPRDRALATEIVYGVLRWRGILDDAIAARAPRGIAKLDAAARIHLEVAAYQILRLERVPAAAAVSAAVDAIRRERGATLAGFGNAVLRAIAKAPALPDEAARARLALPAFLGAALARDLGAETARAVALASLEHAPSFVRTNRGRIEPGALADRIEREQPGAVVTAHPDVPGALRVDAQGDLAALPSHRAGLFTIQDAAAQAVAALVAPRPGERILDACAGRGGKTFAIVEAAGGPVAVDAADAHPGKLERLVAEMARLGHEGVRTMPVDLAIGTAGLEGPYDAALVDAPCTGTGVLSRRPEIRWRLAPEDAGRLAVLQKTILAAVAPLVRRGGRIVYAVCSLFEEEGARVAGSLPGWRVRDSRRFLPHEGTDGFYAAVLET
jgi:16S rRNA (cytosine967-C5)-methyltransferase